MSTPAPDLSAYAHGRVPRDVRRAQLVVIANELVAEGGFAGTTMDAIAARAGVTKPVVYEIFGSKDGIYRALIESAADDLAAAVLDAVDGVDDPMDRLRAGAAAFFRFAADQRSAFRILHTGGTGGRFTAEANALRERQAALVATILSDSARALGTPVEPSAAETAALALNGACEALAAHAVDDPAMTPETLAEWIVALIGPGFLQMAQSATPIPEEHA